jgi:pyruvate dehydrogenase E2 component (dihydrolipoamide acetyltransferase)
MAETVIMPRQGQSVESCIISEWHKKKGDKVKTGELLFSYETDKAAFEEESKTDGTILEILFDEGEDVPVLSNVCIIGKEGEDISGFLNNRDNKNKDNEIEEKETVTGNIKEEKSENTDLNLSIEKGMEDKDTGKLKISPRAKNLAERMMSDYKKVKGTGPSGRIIERDIEGLKQSKVFIEHMDNIDELNKVVENTASGDKPHRDVKLSNIRKVTAEVMYRSLSTTAQLTMNTSFDATNILSYRKSIKIHGEKQKLANITLNDMILFAVSRVLIRHKELNSHFLDDSIRIFEDVHLGVAVDTDRGLLVPTIEKANLKSLNAISIEAKKLAESCKSGKINLDLLKGASFTVTNLGIMGVESFTPVLNPPQTGILGVCNITQRVKETNGEFSYYPAMGLSLTFDHRAVDGAPAARFLDDLKNSLENFYTLLAV